MNLSIQLLWLVVVVVLLHMSSLYALALWIEYGFSRQAFGALVSFLIIFFLPVIVTIWIVRRLGSGFALTPSHWAVPAVLVPLTWISFQLADLLEA